MTAVSTFSANRQGSKKPGKYEAFPEFGDAQLNHSGACLTVALAIAVALDKTLGVILAKAGTRQQPDFHLHQPPGGKGDHVAQSIRIGALPISERKFIMVSVIVSSSAKS